LKRLKIAIVGGGHIVTHRHLPVFSRLDNVEIVAVCDVRKDAADKISRRFRVGKTYTEFSEMLKIKPDVVDICTPPRTHYSMAIEAIESGCSLLIEKPLAMNYDEASGIFRAARKEGVKLCVVHQNLFNPAVQKAMTAVKNGRLGQIVSVDAGTFIRRDNYMCTNQSHWCHSLPGGIFFEILPHPVYLMQGFLTHIQPVCVVAQKVGSLDWMNVDELRVTIKSDESVGCLTSSCNSPYHGDSLSILGTKLGLQVDLWGRTVIEYSARSDQPYSVGAANLRLARQLLGVVGTTARNVIVSTFRGIEISAHYAFIRDYVESVLDDREPPVTEDQALENVAIVNAICSEVDTPPEKVN
jgi:predicted dehydrogenase